MVLYLSSMYTRAELALRVGLFYTTASLSGAFGGLLARGLNEIPTTNIVDAGWRWIMIIEGILTVVIGVTAYFFLPNSVSTARFLSDKERIVAQARLSLNSKGTTQSMSEPEKFRWSEARRGIINPQLLALCNSVLRHTGRSLLFRSVLADHHHWTRIQGQ